MVDKKLDNKVEQYIKKIDSLTSDASGRDDWINRINHYAVPTLYNYKNDMGESRSNLPDDVYDSEMVQAAFEFSNLLYSYLTNPASKWFSMILDVEIMEEAGVKDYLEIVEKKVAQTLALSNFYSTIQQAFHSLTAGNCVIYREKDPKDIVRYYNLPLSECYYEYDKTNRINSMYRRVKKSALQLVEEFPKTVSDKVRKEAEKNKSTTKYTCVHIVRPRWQRDVSKKDKSNKEYESVWINLDTKTLLNEDGYDKFPYFVGHYMRDPHSPYSYGPAHLCFYDAKSLNQLALSVLRRAGKEADPIVNLPYDGFVMPYLQDAGSVNYRTSDDPKDKAEYMMPPPASSAVNENLVGMRDKIKRAFFVDLYRSILDSTKRMTTFEVQQKIADRAPMLGPVIWNLTTDFVNYIIEDVLEILLERKEIDELPEILGGRTFSIKYLSPLARAQQVSEFQSLQAFLGYLQGVFQFNQDVVDVIDFDKWVRVASDSTGIPQSIIREEMDVENTRKARYEQLAKVQGRQEIAEAASAIKDGSQADKNIADAQGA